jgi:molybdopterin-containing oxidoreductase family membrane subunit
VDIGIFVGSLGIFTTLFLLFLRYMPVFAMAELKAVMPQADPHGHGADGHAAHAAGHDTAAHAHRRPHGAEKLVTSKGGH